MTMTNEQKYNTLMLEIGELLRSKNQTISLRDWQLEQVKKDLAKAEETIAELKHDNEMLEQYLEDERKENATLEEALRDAEAEIENYQRSRTPICELGNVRSTKDGDGEC